MEKNNKIKSIFIDNIVDDEYNKKHFCVYKIKHITSIQISNDVSYYYIHFGYKGSMKYLKYKNKKERDIEFEKLKDIIKTYYNGIVYKM